MPSVSGVTGTLYTYPDNFRAQLILIAAEYGSSKLTVAPFEHGNLSQDFLTKFPFGQCPAFEDLQVHLFETMAIASYVGSDALRGSSVSASAQITQWCNTADQRVLPSACQWLYPCYGLMPNNKNVITKAKESIKSFMATLNALLESKTYLVGEYVSLADLALAMYMRGLYTTVMDAEFIAAFGNVTRWFTTIMNQPEVLRVLGVTELCVKPAQFDAKLFNINNPKTPKAAAPKKEAAKPAAKPAAEAAPAAEVAKPAPKKKPFDQYPKSEMNMDDFKRIYWNESTEALSAYLAEKWVDGEWTAWKCCYKYPLEQRTFKTNNLVMGMIQRLEGLRKFGFGLMYVFGDNDKNTVHGVWLCRGDKNPFMECEDWQTDIVSYELTQLDMKVADDKKVFYDFLAGTVDDYKGMPFVKDHIF